MNEAVELARELPPYGLTLEERNARLDKAIDPNHTLPPIDLRRSSTEDPQVLGYRVFLPEPDESTPTYPDGHIGMMTLVAPHPASGEHHATVINVGVHKELRHRGYGLATYLAVMKSLPEGMGLRSFTTLSEGAYKVWRTLEQAGVAVSDRVDEETVRTRDASGDNVYSSVNFWTVFGKIPRV